MGSEVKHRHGELDIETFVIEEGEGSDFGGIARRTGCQKYKQRVWAGQHVIDLDNVR